MKKEHILREIKRTAEANGGIPLGWRRFFRETGIKQSDWLGKFWARWGDAILEAGYTPNRMKTPYKEALLLDKYIELVRELNKIPVKADLLMKVHRDPSFPHQKTFEKFGSKAELVRRVGEYCRNRSGYEDVVALCQRHAITSHETQVESEAVENEIGYVYLTKSGKFYKIGMTNAVGRREYELGLQVPEKPTTVHVIRTDDPAGIETYWHKRFAAKRIRGEWFKLDASDLAAFRRRKFM